MAILVIFAKLNISTKMVIFGVYEKNKKQAGAVPSSAEAGVSKSYLGLAAKTW